MRLIQLRHQSDLRRTVLLQREKKLFIAKARPHLHRVLLQVVWLPESDFLDEVWQATPGVVSVIKHDSLYVVVQDVESKRRKKKTLTVSRLI